MEQGNSVSRGIEEIIQALAYERQRTAALEQENSQLRQALFDFKSGKNVFVHIEGKMFWLQQVPEPQPMPAQSFPKTRSPFGDSLVIDSINGSDPQPTLLTPAVNSQPDLKALTGPREAVGTNGSNGHKKDVSQQGTVTLNADWLK